MADGYYNPLLEALYARDGIYNDTQPTTDKNAARSYDVLNKLLADYREGGINAQVLKQWADGLKAGQSALASTQSMIAKVNETAAASDRVETKAITDLVRTVSNDTTKLATASAQTMSTRIQPALQAFATGGIAEGMNQLLDVLGKQGVRPSLENPDIAGLGQVVASQMFKKPLSELTPEEAASMVGDNPYLQEQTRMLIQHAKNASIAQDEATKNTNAIMDKLTEFTATSSGNITGENLREVQHLLGKLSGYVNTQVGMSATEMREEMERVASLDSEYRRLEQEAEFVKSMAFQPGQEGLRTKIGRAVASDEFQAWAQDNGFRLGQAKIDENGEVTYSPGRDDERAILAYHRQMKTGKPVRLFGTSNTGTRVRITATDPAQQAQLLRDNDIGGGRYAVMEGPDGPAVLDPMEYQRELRRSGFADSGYQQAYANDTVYIKQPGGAVVKYVDGQFVPLADGEEPPTDFKPAMVYSSKDDEVGHFMTAEDFARPPADASNIGQATPADETKIKAASPIKIVSADQLPPLGEVTFDGYLDKLNAQTISQYGTGALSINGGQHVFTKGVTVEVLETKGRDEPLMNVRERRAKRRAAQDDIVTLTAGQVRTALPPTAAPPPPAPPVPVGDMAARAAADTEFAGPRLEMQIAGGVTTPREAAAALAMAGEPTTAGAAPAEATSRFWMDDAGYTFEVVDKNTVRVVSPPEGKSMPAKTEFKRGEPAFEDVVTKLGEVQTPGVAPAETKAAEAAPAAAAPAAPEADVTYIKSPLGTFRVDSSGYTMIQPPEGGVMPAKPETIPLGSEKADAIDEGMREVSRAEGEALERRAKAPMRGAEPKEFEVTERRGSKFIDYSKKPAQLDGGIFGAIGRMRREREAKGEKEAPSAKPPAKAAGKTPFERREEERRQAAMAASLATADVGVPERAPQRKLPEQNLGAAPMYTEVKVPGLRPGDASMSREQVLAAGRLQAAQARQQTPPTISPAEAKLTPEQREDYRVRTEMATRYAPQPVAKGEEPKGTGKATPTPLTSAGKLALFRRMQQSGARPLSATPPTETAK
jgi:hypothetical protein